MKALQRLWVAENPLNGTLPQDWFNTSGVWPVLDYIDMRSTNVTGSIPPVTSNGTFFWTPKYNPKLLVDVSSKPGLCGPLPQYGPQLFGFGEESFPTAGTGFQLAFLPACTPGMPLRL